MPILEIEEQHLDVERWGRRGLAVLSALRMGLPVGNAWLVPADCFAEVVSRELPPEHDPASLLKNIHRTRGRQRAARTHLRLKSVPLPTELEEELAKVVDQSRNFAPCGFSVSPSLTLADPAISAMASSPPCLGLATAASLAQGIREVWSQSVFESALRFLHEQRVKQFSVALVIRPLPRTIERGEIQAARGSASAHAVASRRPPTDAAKRAVVRSPGIWAMPRAGALPRSWEWLSGGAEPEAGLSPAAARRVLLSDRARAAEIDDAGLSELSRPHLDELALAAQRAEASGEKPQWLEYALDKEGGLIVTDLFEPGPAARLEGGDPLTLWSNLPLGELLPSVPTPVSRALATEVLDAGAKAALRETGTKLPKHGQLVASARGRFYMNLSVLGAAGSSLLGTGKHVLSEIAPHSHWAGVLPLDTASQSVSLPRLLRLGARVLLKRQDLSSELEDFEREAASEQRWFDELDLGILPDDALKTTLRETHAFTVRVGETYLRATIGVLIAHVAARALVGRFVPDHDLVSRVLLTAMGGLDTLAGPAAVADFARRVAGDLDASAALEHLNPALLTAESAQDFERFTETFGDRGNEELELASPRWGQDPARVLLLARTLIRCGVRDPAQALSQGRVLADRDLAEADERASMLARGLMRRTRDKLRQLVRMRETMRVAMAQAIGTTRIVILDIDRRLRRIDPELPVGAAFYCTVPELMAAVGRTGADLGALVRARMHERACELAVADPAATFLGAPPRMPPPPRVAGRWLGSGSSAGVVSGPARIIGPGVQGLDALSRGEIPVVRSLDLGLAPLLFSVPGLVAQSGGPTSHGLVLARELATPAVVAADRVLESISDGMLIRVDSDKGVVGRVHRE